MATETHSDTPVASEPKPEAKSPLPGNHDAAQEPSGYKGDNPSTAGPGKTAVQSDTPENRAGRITPSPESVNTTPEESPQKTAEIS